ncbi:phage tail assembly protein [Pseudovibrio sp. Tun.PSC04-5.I4]|uniref:phage tail assembly protein n=1 Tax=Pseudovibrio sp. Tun.PSC04-5.I4 TaxID=1798213 RepID=UPI00088791A4|nr:phage tail assembly protein [Pseudovibrio sp. Tun.PSC04-5.I4]SDR07430.1 Phage tail assembly chaperone protein, E, or 41 or 14 [Pseudovibrio sp. Tun.PSC04-5.I4]
MKKQIVTLASPITINGKDVNEITLVREPIGRELGNFTPFDVAEGNIKALAYVLPKICSPHLPSTAIKDMSTGNIMAMTAGFNRFFDGLEPDGLVKTVETNPSQTTTSTTSPSQSDQKA